MKLSKLKQIIKEEYYNLLSEAFADPEIRKISKMGGIKGNRYNNWFKRFAHTHNIAWDKLPKGTLNKSTNMNDPMIKKGLVFWVNTTSKPNPYGGNRYWDANIPEGVMAVTLMGKVQYDGREGVGPKGISKYGDASGHGKRGTLQLKKLKEIADEIYVMDFESFRGGTKALKAKRAELSLGKDKFKDAPAWRRANLKRYKDILNARVGTRVSEDSFFDEFLWDGKLQGKILCEGAQGAWLDIDHGNYPYVTSSSTLPYGACSLGFPPQKIRRVYGAAKIYDTRSGTDPEFPETLIKDPELKEVIKKGAEFGTTTGRVRKVNWLNLDKLIEAINLTGTSVLIISKVDILEDLNKFKIIMKGGTLEFSDIEEMIMFINYHTRKDCKYIKKILYSDNPEEVRELL